MSFEFPLVIFTVLSQLASGMAIFLCWSMYAYPDAQASIRKSWLWVGVISICGLIASLFHLGHPFMAYKALYNLGASWLSWEGLGFAVFCLLAFITWLKPSRMLGIVTALVGAYSLIAQGLTYAPPSIPALHNALPMALFWLSALAMGGCFLAFVAPGKHELAARFAMLALIAALLGGPAIWVSGTPTMQASSALWASSPWFWIGVALIAAALIATWSAARSAKWQLAALICGIFFTRMVFFADTMHTAAHIGLPYN